MTKPYRPKRAYLLDIDGLRSDVFQAALLGGHLPNLGRILGGPEMHHGAYFEATANCPSITYSCQASTVTGAHPRQHGIVGNMFFDRFGKYNEGKPRFYQFDFTDAPAVYARGLASATLNPGVETLFESAARHGAISSVAYHMYARGAQHWIKPGLEDWKLFAQVAQANFGELYDDHMLTETIAHLGAGNRPDLLLMYFFGLDHESHLQGPEVQHHYLVDVIDPQIGRFLAACEEFALLDDSLFCIFSDHGHVRVENDDLHALKVGLFFDREMGYIFEALGMDVNDHIFESEFDALLAQSGGMAQIYVRHPGDAWRDAPPLSYVERMAAAFWQANASGEYFADMKDALEMIMLRDVEHEGWYADYRVYTPQGLVSIEAFQSEHPELDFVDAANRLHQMSGPTSGDVLLFANVGKGFSFSQLPYKGMHGSLHPDDSNAVLAYALPGDTRYRGTRLRSRLSEAFQARCLAEGNRRISNVDVAYGIRKIMGWE